LEARLTKSKKQLAKYFPRTISQAPSGLVKSNSIVPVLNSSAKARMVMAGIKNKKINGATWKKEVKSAKP
jgi:hypothetical protein